MIFISISTLATALKSYEWLSINISFLGRGESRQPLNAPWKQTRITHNTTPDKHGKYLREIFDLLAFNSFWLSTYWRFPVGNRVVQQEVWGCAEFKRSLAISCLYLLCMFVFCHVCLFWSVAHLGGERGGSHRAICYFEGRLRKDLNIQYRIILFIIIIIISIFIIICCYGGRPREDLNIYNI